MGNISVPGEFFPISDAQALTDVNYLRGGFMSVADITARDAIPNSRRKLGLAVYVQSTATTYVLAGGLTNASWTNLISSASSYASGFSGVATIFNHNLGYYPNVQLIDTSGNLLIGRIEHNSLSQTSVYFNAALMGTGYFS